MSAISRSRPTKLVSPAVRLCRRRSGARRLVHLDAGGEQVAVQASGLRVGIGPIGLLQITAQPVVSRQCLRSTTPRRVLPHHGSYRALVQRVDREGALQGLQRLRLVPVRGRPFGQIGEEIAEAFAQLRPRPDGPVLEPVLGEQIAGVRGGRRPQIGQFTAATGVRRQLLEAPDIDLDRALRPQHHDIVAQLQPPVAGPSPASARRATCSAWWRLFTADVVSRSGHNASNRTSRCSR